MKRAVLFVVVLLSLVATSCAYPAAHYGVKAVTGYVQPLDDGDLSCVTHLFVSVAVSDSVWARCEWWQSGVMLKSDSTRTPRAVYLTFQPPVEVPGAAQVETRWYARDVGGTSCVAKFPQTPFQTLLKPAAFSGLSVAQ